MQHVSTSKWSSTAKILVKNIKKVHKHFFMEFKSPFYISILQPANQYGGLSSRICSWFYLELKWQF